MKNQRLNEIYLYFQHQEGRVAFGIVLVPPWPGQASLCAHAQPQCWADLQPGRWERQGAGDKACPFWGHQSFQHTPGLFSKQHPALRRAWALLQPWVLTSMLVAGITTQNCAVGSWLSVFFINACGQQPWKRRWTCGACPHCWGLLIGSFLHAWRAVPGHCQKKKKKRREVGCGIAETCCLSLHGNAEKTDRQTDRPEDLRSAEAWPLQKSFFCRIPTVFICIFTTSSVSSRFTATKGIQSSGFSFIS